MTKPETVMLRKVTEGDPGARRALGSAAKTSTAAGRNGLSWPLLFGCGRFDRAGDRSSARLIEDRPKLHPDHELACERPARPAA
jgi:hypothetical protein